jgi:hypothetical protein
MDEAGLSVIICLCAVVVVLGTALVVALWRVSRLADKCINHALAESMDQREVMRMKLQTDNQELLLREARRRERENSGTHVVSEPAIDGAEPDIQVATGRSFRGA